MGRSYHIILHINMVNAVTFGQLLIRLDLHYFIVLFYSGGVN